ncbi:hypothetical protein DM02DRAFT_654377 [Periconia macrospinosa]|uniref:Uncharacterized protein n=1 Tax=Periconia macrospinosa TaxID=97972 RepID=A0A2V1DTY5_9PLEO|nr:hypothetical protein DM02DRAFT_654377 [Periconia macrospinosa]
MPKKRAREATDRYADVDPAYLWIMPEWLKLTHAFESARDTFLAEWKRMITNDQKNLYLRYKELEFHLYLLDDYGTKSGTYLEMSRYLTEDLSYRVHARAAYRNSKINLQKTSTVAQYVRVAGIVDALYAIGLEINGGIERLLSIMEDYDEGDIGFPLISFIVRDAEKASQYIDIGVHLGSDIKLNSESQSLDKATKNHARLLDLVNVWGDSGKEWNTLEEDIAQGTIRGEAAHVIWEYKRDRFRVKTVKRFRKILIKRAVKETIRRKRRAKRSRKKHREEENESVNDEEDENESVNDEEDENASGNDEED